MSWLMPTAPRAWAGGAAYSGSSSPMITRVRQREPEVIDLMQMGNTSYVSIVAP